MEANHYSRPSARYITLGLLTVVYSFNFIDRQLLSILQESIKADLSLSDSQLGLLTGFAFALFYVTAGIPLARWADRGNRRNIISLALFVWSFMTAISGAAMNYFYLLLARIGVGIGEAGGSPPSHSIISDIFPASSRATAMSIYSTGVSIGVLFGFLLGGWLNEFFGWRVAFVVVGAPGILLAIIIRLVIKEPTRGYADKNTNTAEEVTFLGVVQLLWSRRSFRFIAAGASLSAFVGYGLSSWVASFFIRTHGMGTGELGTWLALIMGVGGACGIMAGGIISDKLGQKDQRWYVWVSAIVLLCTLGPLIALFLVSDKNMALLCLALPGSLANIYLGSAIATTHGMVGLKMRATASAILFFILNLIGLGLGPWSIGVLSDLLLPSYGGDSLRYAMLAILPVAGLLSAIMFALAGRTLKDDLAKAPH